MALTENQISKIREELENCKNPIIFFHDDADGLCSFLLLYRFVKQGKGIIIKTTPKIDEKFARNVAEYGADKVFIVDIAIVDQEFIDAVDVPIIWIDHHTPLKREKVMYFNPRINDPKDNLPVSSLCYQVVKEDLWIATLGTIADWHWPKFIEEFKKQYPDLLDESVNDSETALFETKVGKLIDMISFCLKGTTKEAISCAKILTRIKTPYEILNEETAAGKYIHNKYEEVNKEYQSLLKRALKQKADGKILLFRYLHGKISFTKDIANEFLHRFPDKIIIIAREKSGEMKISLRSKDIPILPVLEKSLQGINGFGGGHEFACGANIMKDDFDRFIENIKSNLEK